MTEQQWIARARHGDADAFEQLVVAYEGPVYRLALRMCGRCCCCGWCSK